ncbi:MAG: primary-amine oxidase [Solirubrobacteraceae bacterium]|nr:primary-amine oxidase [Solirubrobacteraceae bacterium]
MNPLTAAPTGTHPLDSLTGEEITEAARILKEVQGLGDEARFVSIVLHEPHKSRVREWSEGDPVPREAFIVLRNRETKGTYEAVVSLSEADVVRYELMEGVQASITFEEFMACEDVVRASPEWREAIAKRGVTDVEMCMLDPWSSGYLGPDDHPSNRRICRPLTWVRQGDADDNGYARPIEGLQVVVDLDAMEVVEVIDHGVVPLPPKSGNYAPDLAVGDENNVPAITGLREDVKPIDITQPEGASFTVDGSLVEWQKWQLRIGFNSREALVLYDIAYNDGGTLRPICHRASIAEMYIPYADPQPTQSTKNVFDMGEYGIGWLANPLELGCDCLGEIKYFDGVVNDQDGSPVVIPNAICMHEEDYGIGWKHTDFRTEKVEVRRLRRLVVSTICTVGNYEYGFFWHLYTDGTIELEVKLTGCLTTNALPVGETTPYGQVLAPGLYGPHHQHFFSVRLDMEVDGPQNRVVEVDSVPEPMGPDNPIGSYWKTERTVLESEQQAQRVVDPTKGRFWKIENPGVENAIGEPTAYKLMPGENVFAMNHPDGIWGQRGAFAQKHLWVTPYDPGERYPAGDYPNQHPGGAGLPAWTAADRPVDNEDVVVWYSFGAHHVVRMEDWPVMPVHHLGFKLKPSGFFNGNPSLDMPPSAPKHSGHSCH